jgi:hypothetical protein
VSPFGQEIAMSRIRRSAVLTSGVLVCLLAAPTGGPAVAATPGFTSSVSRVTAKDLPHSWRSGCPVGPAQLRAVQLAFWGFDARRHTGRIVVHEQVVAATTAVFGRLYAARFPVRSIRPVDDFGGSDDRSMAADNTSGFNCRKAVASGPPRWSVHAYGKAIDINPVENPYVQGRRVDPPAGRAFAKRTPYRAGMAVAGGTAVRAFSVSGWAWGGRWAGTPDYQHFSATGG